MDTRIYLDYNASTPIDPEVVTLMRTFLDQYYGNPSSAHWYGLQAKMALEHARKQVAALLNAAHDEIIFTSGGTESNNMAIRGIASALQAKGRHIITSSVEHPSVLEVCRYLEKEGFSITYLEVDDTGRVDPDTFENAFRQDTVLVTIMHANNEVGTIQPIREISAICRKHKVILHTDAAQSIGKTKVDVKALGVDLLSLAGHKLYGPKGVGALYIRRGVRIDKLLLGADHEQNLRPGTENTLEIAGLGQACEIAVRDLKRNMDHYTETAEMLWKGLSKNIEHIRRNGNQAYRLANTVSVSFRGIEANLFVSALENIAVSAGAACHTDNVEISHVLEAMNIPEEYAMGTIRFSTGRGTTTEDIETAIKEITGTVRRLQAETGEGGSLPEGKEKIALTHFTNGLGCACKLRPQALEKVLKHIPVLEDHHTLVGTEWADDAAVYQLDKDHALVKTVDFFTPVVDDPWWFGAIAAANALSDIYAMGAKPLFALNIVGFPSNRLPLTVLEEILKGAADKCREAGIPVLGGHTIDDNEPKFGMVVTGMAHPKEILTNKGAQPRDMLILTKPVGTGIISTGIKRGIVPETIVKETMEIMGTLNNTAADILKRERVHACTDITGFGLIGHLSEITRASKVNATLVADDIPIMSEAIRLAEIEVVPGGTQNNITYTDPFAEYQQEISLTTKIILNDAQTSGGLLACVPEERSAEVIDMLRNNGIDGRIIGKIDGHGLGKIKIT